MKCLHVSRHRLFPKMLDVTVTENCHPQTGIFGTAWCPISYGQELTSASLMPGNQIDGSAPAVGWGRMAGWWWEVMALGVPAAAHFTTPMSF